MAQHHFRRKDNRAWVDFVLACVFRRGAVRRFKQRALVADVSARRDADAANLRRQSVRDVVAVQVHTGDHVVLGRAQQNLLQERIGDHVFNNDLFAGVRVLDFHPRAAVQQLAAELFARQLVAPVFKRAFGELHDVAFVNQGHRVAIVGDGIFNRRAHQALSARFRARLHADAALFREANLVHAHLFAQELDHFIRFRSARFPLDAGIDVFTVFTEDHHIGVLRTFYRAWGALIVAYRTQTDVQVQLLTQRNVKRTDTAANRRRQRAFDGNAIVLNQVKRLLRQPYVRAIHLRGFLTGVNFHPGNFSLAVVGFFHSGINHFDHDRRYIHANAVTFNIRDDRISRDNQFALTVKRDFLTFRRNNYFAFH